jgi:hypothetical protein
MQIESANNTDEVPLLPGNRGWFVAFFYKTGSLKEPCRRNQLDG